MRGVRYKTDIRDDGAAEGKKKKERERESRNWILNPSIPSRLQRSLFKRWRGGERARYRRDKRRLARAPRRFERIRTGDTRRAEEERRAPQGGTESERGESEKRDENARGRR